jgi:hypothetical protein
MKKKIGYCPHRMFYILRLKLMPPEDTVNEYIKVSPESFRIGTAEDIKGIAPTDNWTISSVRKNIVAGIF